MPTALVDPATAVLDVLVAPCPGCGTRYVARLATGEPAGECAHCTAGIDFPLEVNPTAYAGHRAARLLATIADLHGLGAPDPF